MIGEKKSIAGSIMWVSFRLMLNVLLVLIIVQGYTNAYHFSYKLFLDVPYVATSTEMTNVTLEAGTDVVEAGTILEEFGIVDSKYLLIARAYLGKYYDKIQPGTYALGPGMSPEEICKVICCVQSEDTP